MKLKSNLNLGVVFILATLPSTAFAASLKGTPVGEVAKASKGPVSKPISFFHDEKKYNEKNKVNLIALTSEEHKNALESGKDINELLAARADELCKSKHFKGAATLPLILKEKGDVKAYDFHDKQFEIVELKPISAVKGTQYVQRMHDGTKKVISKSEYEERTKKGGLFARAISEEESDILHFFFKDLTCSYQISLTNPDQTALETESKSNDKGGHAPNSSGYLLLPAEDQDNGSFNIHPTGQVSKAQNDKLQRDITKHNNLIHEILIQLSKLSASINMMSFQMAPMQKIPAQSVAERPTKSAIDKRVRFAADLSGSTAKGSSSMSARSNNSFVAPDYIDDEGYPDLISFDDDEHAPLTFKSGPVKSQSKVPQVKITR